MRWNIGPSSILLPGGSLWGIMFASVSALWFFKSSNMKWHKANLLGHFKQASSGELRWITLDKFTLWLCCRKHQQYFHKTSLWRQDLSIELNYRGLILMQLFSLRGATLLCGFNFHHSRRRIIWHWICLLFFKPLEKPLSIITAAKRASYIHYYYYYYQRSCTEVENWGEKGPDYDWQTSY